MFEQKPTLKQIQANRLNAQKSTGPRSAEGKAASSMNALKSGIHAQSLVIRGESAEDLATLTAEYYDHWQPVTPQERLWLDALIRNEWLLRRLAVAEAQMWDHVLASLPQGGGPPPLGRAFYSREETFERLQRRLSTTQLNCARALHELERLQKLRGVGWAACPSREAAPNPCEPATPAESASPIAIGFVPQNPPPPSSAPHPVGFVSQNPPGPWPLPPAPRAKRASPRPPALDAAFSPSTPRGMRHLAQVSSGFSATCREVQRSLGGFY